MTALTGWRASFTHLALARVGVGVGEAGCSPPAHSLISDMFPVERRGTALAIYSLGIPIGGALGSRARRLARPGSTAGARRSWPSAFRACCSR